METNRPKVPALEEHAQAIGYVSIIWAWLENVIALFIQNLAPLKRGKIGQSFRANMDMRDKIEVLRAVAFERKPSDEWFENLNSLLNKIDNDFRPLRNRYAHDLWHLPKGKVVKRQMRTKLKRPQSFRFEFSTHEDMEVQAKEIWAFASEMYFAWLTLLTLQEEYDNARKALRSKSSKWFLHQGSRGGRRKRGQQKP